MFSGIKFAFDIGGKACLNNVICFKETYFFLSLTKPFLWLGRDCMLRNKAWKSKDIICDEVTNISYLTVF